MRIIEVAEASGTLTEVLRHQAEHYKEQAARRMTALTFLLSVLIWLSLIVFVVVVVIRFMLFYVVLLNDLADGKL